MARARRTPDPIRVMCCDCKNAVPVLHEFRNHEGEPIFCTCQFERHYKMLRWPQPCQNFEEKDER